MKIILSPAKKMRVNIDDFEVEHLPQFLEQAEQIMHWLKTKDREELKKLWKCNDSILEQNIERLSEMDLCTSLTPAVIAYEGIAFQYMAPEVMEKEELIYLEDHLRILSAFYGVLRPFDGVTPYRLEMQAKAQIEGSKDLYAFWNSRLYEQVCDESHVIVNLASKEYSKCISPYLTEKDHMLNITFCEMVKGKLSTKGTCAKMARGEMVRYMAENRVEEVAELKGFDRLGYHYRGDLSTETEYIFERR